MSYGVTPSGFIRLDFDLIQKDIEEDAKLPEFFGEDVDLSEYSPIGIFIKLMAKKLANLWEVMEDVYYSNYIDTAEGVSLSRIAAFKGLARNPERQSVVTLQIKGVIGVYVPDGFIASTKQGIKFITTEGGIITDGKVELNAVCLPYGVIGNVCENSITEINTPLAGVEEVNNPVEGYGGREVESDYELRKRYKEGSGVGGASAVSIQAVLNEIDSVISAVVNENCEDFEVDGMPPHCLHAVINGGTDSEIVDVFMKYKSGGIKTIGEKHASIIDIMGVERTFYWDNPDYVNIYVLINIITNEKWDSSYIDEVKKRVIEVIGGSFKDQTYKGEGVSKDVYRWKILANMDEFEGIENIEVFVGKTEMPTGIKVEIEPTEYARTSQELITVNVL